MPTYDFECSKCSHVWEDILSSWKSPLPSECPNCKRDSSCITKLPSLVAPGKVELTGQDFKDSIKAGARQILKDASKNENAAANIVGESKFHSNQLAMNKK